MASKPVKYKWETWNDFLELQDYVVVDLTATGQSVEKENIIELGMIKVTNGVPTDRFYSLVNPDRSIPTRVENATGVTDEIVCDAPKFGEIAEEVHHFLDGCVLVAFNSASVAGFLAKELGACKKPVNLEHFEMAQLSRRAFPALGDSKLEDVIAYLGMNEATSLEMEDVHGYRANEKVAHVLQIMQMVHDNYDTALARAIARCCSPIVDYFVDVDEEYPLAGKRVAVLGDLTFSASNARKLVEAAGGLFEAKLNKDTDVLVCGYIDPNKHPKWMEPAMKKAQYAYVQGAKMATVNEVGLLKMCGTVFTWGEDLTVQAGEKSKKVDDLISNAVERSKGFSDGGTGSPEAEREGFVFEN